MKDCGVCQQQTKVGREVHPGNCTINEFRISTRSGGGVGAWVELRLDADN